MASRTKVPRSAASSAEFPTTIRTIKYKVVLIGLMLIGLTVVFVSVSRVACQLRCLLSTPRLSRLRRSSHDVPCNRATDFHSRSQEHRRPQPTQRREKEVWGM